MSEEVLGWLLPEARAEERLGMRRVITALRLLREDARGRAARRAAPSWQHARRELESLERRQRRRAIDGLLHAYLSALRSPDSFLELGPRPLAYDDAWRTLLQAGPAEGLPPAPAEAPLAVVERLLAAGEASGASASWSAWWRACSRHVSGPPARVEHHWRALFRSELEAGARPALLARLLAGLAAARLERFQPARAWALHERHAELVAADAGLRRLFGWSALLCGHETLARGLLRDGPPTLLPAPLAELREDRPGWAALLAGPRSTPAPARAGVRPALDRAAFGALLLGVFARRADGSTELLALDAPEELCMEVARRCEATRAPGTLVAGTLRRQRRTGGELDLAEAFGGTGTCALALAAVRDPEGELAGWIQLESAHLLLPCATTLSGLAGAWRDRILSARRPRQRPRVEAGPAPSVQPFGPDDPRREFARRLFAGLAPLGGWQATWLEPGERGESMVRGEQGVALGDLAARPGGGGVERRARAERVFVCHRGERSESLHAAAASGFALPMLDARGARLLGVLVLESPRSELPSDALLAAARATLAALEPMWWATSFRAACRARDGLDLAWEPGARFLSSLAPALEGAAGSRAPLLLVGPAGAGRRTLARWLHFCGPCAEQELVLGGSAAGGGSRVVDVVDIGMDTQRELLARVAGERLFLLSEAPLSVLRERGVLARELERVLDPLPIVVPPLRDRRDEIPALVQVLADNAARREGLRRPRFDDRAVGDCWRQDWRGNVSELSALVTQLVRAFPGRAIGGAEVRAAMRSRGLEFRERLPSLRPSALDLELALASTRHRSGNENRARAARYLGWDSDTLRARLRGRGRPAPGAAHRSRREREAPAVSRAGASPISPEAVPTRLDP